MQIKDKIKETVGKVGNMIGDTAKDIDEIMNRVLPHKKYTEEGDLLQKDIRDLQEAKPSAEFMKTIKRLLPGLPRIVEEDICTSRDDSRKSYEDRTLVLAPALSGALGIPAVSAMKYLNTVEGISNVSAFCEQKGMAELPHYQTITEGLDSIVDMEGFNRIYSDLFSILDRSRRYDTTRPIVVYWGKKGQDGVFTLCVARVTPLIGDGTEVARKRQRMSDQDLVFVFPAKEGKGQRIEYAQKFMTMVADMGDILVPFCAEPIENEAGIDYTAIAGQKDTERRKQECEIKVAKKMLAMVKECFPGKVFMPQGDGLYAARPFMDTILEYNWPFIFTFKEGCAPSLFKTAMEAMDQQVKDYDAGRLKTSPIRKVVAGETVMEVQIVNNVGALADNPDWEDYPLNVIKATYQEEFTVCNERAEQQIRTRRRIAEARTANEASPLPNFTKEECKNMFRERYKKSHPKLKDEQIEEILEGVTFTQTLDKVTLCRIVKAHICQRFIWITNIVLDLEDNKEAKALLMKKILGEDGDEEYKKRRDAKDYLTGYLGRIIYQARRRWNIELLFQTIKGDLFKVGKKKRHKSYKVEKALFYITLLSWLFLELYRTYNKYAAKGLKRWSFIADCLKASFRNDDVNDEKEYMNRRTCYRPQLE